MKVLIHYMKHKQSIEYVIFSFSEVENKQTIHSMWMDINIILQLHAQYFSS